MKVMNYLMSLLFIRANRSAHNVQWYYKLYSRVYIHSESISLTTWSSAISLYNEGRWCLLTSSSTWHSCSNHILQNYHILEKKLTNILITWYLLFFLFTYMLIFHLFYILSRGLNPVNRDNQPHVVVTNKLLWLLTEQSSQLGIRTQSR